MALPQDFIAQLHDRTEIVDLIGNYVDVKRKGRIYSGLCPFHNEKTPSFVVYPETQSFYCFGCGTGGDAITFIKLRENLEYIEAVRLLAGRAGMVMPEDNNDGNANIRRRILAANKLAARFFYTSLNTEGGRHARGYLRGRKLNDETIKKFGLGYAPDGWDALKHHLNEQGFSNQELIEAGLCSAGKDGKSTYDFFRNRLMFPVIDVRGNVIAFSGRALIPDDPRKYVNTRDTPVFKKSRTLYAINIAKSSGTRKILVTEGQMDVIAIHQAGFDNAVAALGTALTAEHARIIVQYADEVILAYDGDEAGQRATRRAIDTFKSTNLQVRVLSYEGAKDPDEYIKKYGADGFRALLEDSSNSVEYELGRAARRHDLETDGGRVQYLAECAEILARSDSPTERELYAGRSAELAGVGKASLLLQIEQLRKRNTRRERRDADTRFVRGVAERYGERGQDGSKLGALAAERRLVALVFHNPDLCGAIRTQLEPQDFVSQEIGAVYDSLTEAIRNDRFFGFSSLSQTLEPKSLSILSGILAENSGVSFTPEDANYLIDKIQKHQSVPNAEAIKAMDAETLKRMMEEKKQRQ